jgi:hypothetical protein
MPSLRSWRPSARTAFIRAFTVHTAARREPGPGCGVRVHTEHKPPHDDGLPDHLARWLEAVSKRLHAELSARGMRDFPGLRGSHRRILQMIPPQGIWRTDYYGNSVAIGLASLRRSRVRLRHT